MGNKNKRAALNFIKGIAIGASMLIPGVSGGTMAIILGIYDQLIRAVCSFHKHLKRNCLLLLQFGLGGLLGIILFARPLLHAVTQYQLPMMYLFFGAIIASLPPLYKKATVKKCRPIHYLAIPLGFLLVMLTSFFPKEVFTFADGERGFSPFSLFLLLVSGLIIAVALVLPGISASYMLLMLGMYDVTLQAISSFNLMFLIPLAVSVLIGTVLTTGVLEKSMRLFPQTTYLLIIGFVLASIWDVFPGFPKGLEILVCLATFGIGFTGILMLQRFTAGPNRYRNGRHRQAHDTQSTDRDPR